MATNPMVAQGVLNRLRASVVCADHGELNITAPYLGKNMIRVAFEGNSVEQFPTATGLVNAPEPYVQVTVTAALLRTQQLAASWLNQMLTNSKVGSMRIHSDTGTFPVMDLYDMVIRSVDPGPYDGSGPDVNLTLHGLMYVNNDLWSYA